MHKSDLSLSANRGSRKINRRTAAEIRRIPLECLTGLGEVRDGDPVELEARPAGNEPFPIDLNLFNMQAELKTSAELTPAEIRSSLSLLNCLGCEIRPKKRAMSHCSVCYHSLPPKIQRALYKRFGQGYEQAFRDSIDYLRENA